RRRRIRSVLQCGGNAGRQTVDSPKLLAGQRHIPVAVFLSLEPRADHERQPIVRRQFVNASSIIFLVQGESRLLQVRSYRFSREEVQVPGNVLAEKMSGSNAAKIGNQKYEQSTLFYQLRSFSEVRHRVVHMLENRPGRHRVVGWLVHRDVLKLLRVYPEIS